MRDYAANRNWAVAIEVRDVASGATTRPQRETLIEAARRREIDCVLVWRLDRWGRSLVDLVNTIQELSALDGLAAIAKRRPAVRSSILRVRVAGRG